MPACQGLDELQSEAGIGAPVSAPGSFGMGEYDATHQLPIVPGSAFGPSSAAKRRYA